MKKTIIALIPTLILALLVTACGKNGARSEASPAAAASSDTPAAASSAPASETPAAAKKIIVGTGTQFPHVCYIDENGKLTGFDVELVREIDNRLAAYEFEFQTLDFTTILLSLETKKIDFGAHEYEKNPERTAKYLFNNEPYAHWKNKIIVAKETNDIQTLDDLAGKKVLTNATSAEAQILENYNKSHDKKIDIVYQSGAANDTVSQITSGRVAATIGADFVLPLIDPQGKLKTAGEALSEADILFVFRQNDPDSKQLADAIDGAIRDLKADGTLSKLSQQFLGQDFTS